MTLEEAKQWVLELLFKYERTQNPQTLTRAVTAYRRLLEAVPQQGPDRVGCLANSGIAFLRLAELNTDVSMLREAAMACKEAASLALPDHPEYLSYQYDAALVLNRLFELTADPALLPDAARAARNTVNVVGPDGPGRAEMLSAVADKLVTVYEWLGELSDLRLAVTAFRAAASDLPRGSRSRGICQTRLCVALRLLYERTDDLDARGGGDRGRPVGGRR